MVWEKSLHVLTSLATSHIFEYVVSQGKYEKMVKTVQYTILVGDTSHQCSKQ